MTFRRAFLVITLTICLMARIASGQYMYLDSNGNSFHDPGDCVAGGGDTTTVDIWLDTNHNQDGTLAECGYGPEVMTINSYEFILRSVDGSVLWGAYTNSRPEMVSQVETSSNGSEFHTGFAGAVPNPPGLYKLGTLLLQVETGSPRVDIVPTFAFRGTFATSFGSQCLGTNQDNTLTLGTDWTDVNGLDAPLQGIVTFNGQEVGAGVSETESPNGETAAPMDSGCAQSAVACDYSGKYSVGACLAADASVGRDTLFFALKNGLGQYVDCEIRVYATSNLASEIYTGGHCHDPDTRPLPVLSPTSGNTNGAVGFRTVVTWPEVAGRYHIWWETVSGGSCAPYQSIKTACVRRQPTFDAGLFALGAGQGFELTHGNDNLTRHPDHHYGTAKFNEALRQIAKAFGDSIPGVPILGYNDMSLRWGGVFDESTAHVWSPPHCGHRNGDMVDMRTQVANVPRYTTTQLGILKKILKDRGIRPIIHPIGGPVPAHWHLQPIKKGSFD